MSDDDDAVYITFMADGERNYVVDFYYVDDGVVDFKTTKNIRRATVFPRYAAEVAQRLIHSSLKIETILAPRTN
jgi:hypothetical protein